MNDNIEKILNRPNIQKACIINFWRAITEDQIDDYYGIIEPPCKNKKEAKEIMNLYYCEPNITEKTRQAMFALIHCLFN